MVSKLTLPKKLTAPRKLLEKKGEAFQAQLDFLLVDKVPLLMI